MGNVGCIYISILMYKYTLTLFICLNNYIIIKIIFVYVYILQKKILMCRL